jgi:hypothetical protein
VAIRHRSHAYHDEPTVSSGDEDGEEEEEEEVIDTNRRSSRRYQHTLAPPSDIASDSASTIKHRQKRNRFLKQKQTRFKGRQHRTTPSVSEWAHEDVNEFLSEEFDFEQNLQRFDKKKVFAEIRASI